MIQIIVTCPHCEFSKAVDAQRLPAGSKRIKCPKCGETFLFAPPEAGQNELSFAVVEPAPAEGGSNAEFCYCSSCGQRIHRLAEICPKCGVRVAAPAHALSKLALLLITFFLGGMGAHKFYQKKYWQGALYLLFFWTYIPSLLALVEFIVYACRSEAELQRRYPEVSGSSVVIAFVGGIVGLAVIGILAAIAIPQFAAYREKSFRAAALADLAACHGATEAYFAQYQAYPQRRWELQCRTADGISLYYLALGPDEYQLVGFHDRGRQAYLRYNGDGEISENSREEIRQQIEEQYGSEVLGPDFHFIE